jgi:hypothetical protein
MAGSIEGVDRQQATLFPERLDALMAGDALVRVIDGFVDHLDVGAAGFIRAHCLVLGRPGSAGRVSAGRSLAAFPLRLHERGALEPGAGAGVLGEPGAGLAAHPKAAGCLGDPELRRLQPDFKTIADFRKDNGDAISWTCQAFVRFALSHGLIKGRLVATDGSRFRAASSRRRRQAREDVEADSHPMAAGRHGGPGRSGRTRWRSRAIWRIWRRPMPWSTRPSRRPSGSG